MNRAPRKRWEREPRRNYAADVWWCLTCNRCLPDNTTALCSACRTDWERLQEQRHRWAKSGPTGDVRVRKEDLALLQVRRDDLADTFVPLITAYLEGESLQAAAEQVIDTIAALVVHIDTLPDPREAPPDS